MNFLHNLFRKSGWSYLPAMGCDAAAISRLHSASFARGWSESEVEAMLSDASVLAEVARKGRTVEGFIITRIAVDEADLLSIAFAPRRRRTGGATGLLRHHLGRLAAMGVRRVVLEVDEINTPARGLYEKFGFEPVGTRPAYYPRRDGTRGMAQVMARSL